MLKWMVNYEALIESNKCLENKYFEDSEAKRTKVPKGSSR